MRIEPTERGEPISAVDILAMGVRGALNLGELVAHTAHGQDVAGVLGIRLYLLPYVADLHIRRAGVPRELGAPHCLHDLSPAVYPPGVGGEEPEDVELRGREVHGGALSNHLATRHVDRQPRKLQAFLLRGDPGVDAPAPQGRADAAHQLPVGKGLGDVVVGSDLEPNHDAHLVVTGGQHDHRDVTHRGQLLADGDAVYAWEHDVQYHEVERSRAGEDLERSLAVGDRLDLHTFIGERVADHITHGVVVLHDEYPRHRVRPPVALSSL